MKEQKQANNRYYGDYVDWKGWKNPFSFTKQDARYFHKEFSSYLDNNSKILEIGFGGGRFMGWAKSQNYNVVGLEILDELIEKAQAKGYVACNVNGFTPAHEFNLVIAISVLEHLSVDQLADTLNLIAKSLKPGGVAICRVPNGLSPFGRVYQHGDITHVQTITPSRLLQVIAMNQIPLKISEVRNPAVPIGFGRGPIYVTANTIRLVLRWLLYRSLAAIVGIPPYMDSNLIVEFHSTDQPSTT